jgi:Mn-dependent DtxR family transcriptional regulator
VKQLYTTKELAEMLKRSSRSVSIMLKRLKMGRRIGKYVYINELELERLIGEAAPK